MFVLSDTGNENSISWLSYVKWWFHNENIKQKNPYKIGIFVCGYWWQLRFIGKVH